MALGLAAAGADVVATGRRDTFVTQVAGEIEASGRRTLRQTCDVGDAESVRRWCEALGTTDEALLKAVQQVGTRVDRIKSYLGAGGNAADQADG